MLQDNTQCSQWFITRTLVWRESHCQEEHSEGEEYSQTSDFIDLRAVPIIWLEKIATCCLLDDHTVVANELFSLYQLRHFVYPSPPQLFSHLILSHILSITYSGHIAGQFCWIQIPAVHALEWHPFTISSSPSSALGENGTVCFR